MARTYLTAPLTLYTDYVNGNDSNDGLHAVNSPMKTAQAAMMRASTTLDFGGQQITIRLADNTTDLQGIHFAPHALVGAEGGAALIVEGGTNSVIQSNTSTAVDLFNGAVAMFKNLKLVSGAGACANASYGARLYLQNIEFGAAAAFHIGTNSFGNVVLYGNTKISGNAGAFLTGNQGYFEAGGDIKFMSNTSYSWFVMMNGGLASFGPTTITLDGKTVTGQRYSVSGFGKLISSTGSPDTYFPGNSNGTTNGGQGICV
jgi:hypothetical protein